MLRFFPARVATAVFLLIAWIPISNPKCNAESEQKYPNTFQANARDVAVIRRYVERRKHWDSRNYRIEPLHRENGYLLYEVVYLEDLKRHFANGRESFEFGGGKSFGVYYDQTNRRVVKEFYFQ